MFFQHAKILKAEGVYVQTLTHYLRLIISNINALQFKCGAANYFDERWQ
jgi:hypothetical protein